MTKIVLAVIVAAALGLGLYQLTAPPPDRKVVIEPPVTYDTRPRMMEPLSAATPDILHDITSPENAERIFAAGMRVFDHYTFANRPARRPPPDEYASFFESAPIGLCESASLTFGMLIEDEFVARNFNVVTKRRREPHPLIQDNYRLTGHTFSVVNLESGSVGVDPTYGAILVSTAPDFDHEVMQSRNFKIYSLFDWNDPEETYFREHLHFFTQLEDDATFASYSGEYMQLRFPIIEVQSSAETHIGKIDGSDQDMIDLFGGWGNHLGFWYEPSEHIWRFSPEEVGQYNVTFHLLGGERSFVLSEPFEYDFLVEGGELVEHRAVPSHTNPETLSWRIQAEGDFQIRIRSLAVAARLIDGIEIRRLSLGERIAGATARGVAGLTDSFCLLAPSFPACPEEAAGTLRHR